MITQPAEIELVEPRTVNEAVAHSRSPFAVDLSDDNEQAVPGRGIIAAVLIATPFWALLAAAAYILL